MVLEANGRIYLGKDALLDKDTFRKMYPGLERWMEVKRKYDPFGKYSSNISRRLGLGLRG
jgi:decaprenylphospho-beta-D-ribofuranose 2-oxidase